MAAAHVLIHEYIAPPGEEHGGFVGAGITLRAVRRAGNQDRILAVFDRTVDVGVEDHAVPHGDWDEIFHFEVIAGRPGRWEFHLRRWKTNGARYVQSHNGEQRPA